MGDISESEIKDSMPDVDFCYVQIPEASVIAEIAVDNYKSKTITVDCKPVYLRAPEIGIPKNAPRVIE